jgi:hypothetical protein
MKPITANRRSEHTGFDQDFSIYGELSMLAESCPERCLQELKMTDHVHELIKSLVPNEYLVL